MCLMTIAGGSLDSLLLVKNLVTEDRRGRWPDPIEEIVERVPERLRGHFGEEGGVAGAFAGAWAGGAGRGFL